MKDSARIYLCGSVKKGRDDKRSADEFWSEGDEERILNCLKSDVSLLNPSKTPICRQDYFVNFGCDIWLIQSADVLFADLRKEKGIGVGAELMFARQEGIPVIAWLPQGSHYRRDLSNVFGEDLKDWIHPFAYTLSDYIEETLDDVCRTAQKLLAGSLEKKCSGKSINSAVAEFVRNYPGIANWQKD